MTSMPDLFFFGLPTVAVFFSAAVKFVGLAFFLSLILGWTLVQGLVWLAERYSRMISGTEWWKSAIIAVLATTLMVIAWTIPRLLTGAETDYINHALTSAILAGGIVTWILSGRFYRFEFLHRLIVAIGVPLLVICAMVLGQVLHWKISG